MLRWYSCDCKYHTPIWLQMQVHSETDMTSAVDRLVGDGLPDRRGLEAWRSLLQAHASLMRELETDLERETGLALADFDVLAQLALAGGELRMTELAAKRVHLTIGHDAPRRPAGRRRPRSDGPTR